MDASQCNLGITKATISLLVFCCLSSTVMMICVALAHGLTKSTGLATLNQGLRESEDQEEAGKGDSHRDFYICNNG